MLAFRVRKLLGSLLGILAFFGLTASNARAEIYAHLNTVTGSSGNYTWSYSPDLTSGANANSGDYFELVGFKGFNGSHSEPAGWTFQSGMNLPMPDNLNPTAVPDAPDLVWKYTGSTPLTGPLSLGTFTAGSTLGAIATGQIVAQTTSNQGTSAGTPIQDIATVPMPGPGSPLGTVVPEPGALLIWAAFTLPLAWFGRRRMLQAA
jgi:hypothetical protein